MKKCKNLMMVWLMILAIVLCTGVSVKAAEDTSIEAFVTRFYVHILNRQPDGGGLAAWSENLRSGKEAGVNVGYGFVQSDEFKNRNLNDEEYIKVLYRAFFDREADAGGLNAWKQVLDSGLSRLHVYKGFAESAEFTGVCVRYGINRGTITLTAPMDQNEGVTKFVARCYNLCLGRRADEAGLNAWCSQLLSGANSAKQAAHGFVFSDEFLKKNLSDREYVKVLYRVFMDREADSAGMESWIKVLTNGKSREHVFNGFADSNEFKKICDGYGIYAGEATIVDESWKQIYIEKIRDFENEYRGTNAYLCFGLYDINGDDIPELILSMHGGGSSSAITNEFYTVKNGKLYNTIDRYGLDGQLSFRNNSIIVLEGHNMTGDFTQEFYQMTAYDVDKIGYISGNYSDDETTYKYYLGNYPSDFEVSKNEFIKKTGADQEPSFAESYNLGDVTVTIDNIESFVS